MSNIIFPTLVSSNWKLTRTPMWTTLIQRSSSGKRTAAALQSKVRWKWTLKNGILQSDCSIQDLQAIQNLFNGMYGAFDSFLYPDPEPCSITPGYKNYFPCAFTDDTVDFDRICYEIWECGKLEFEQVGDPILVPVPHCCAPDSGGDGGSGDFPPVQTGAVLSVKWAYMPTTYQAIASLNIGYPGAAASIRSNTGWGVRTDSVNVALDRVSGLTVSFYLDGSLSGSGLARLQIYDLTLVITSSDLTTQTLKPGFFAFDNGSGTGAIINPTAAVDADPATFAELQTSAWAPLAIPPVFSVSSFI